MGGEGGEGEGRRLRGGEGKEMKGRLREEGGSKN